MFVISVQCFIIISSVFFFDFVFFFFKQKTAYEMRISDWSSDVCSSDLLNSLPVPENRWERVSVDFIVELEEAHGHDAIMEIGRASCRESVSVRVDLGGRRIIKKKNIMRQSISKQIFTTTTNIQS